MGSKFIISSNGAKIYDDESMQPKLEVLEGTVIRRVLSLAVSKSGKPMATVQEENEAVCYILPDAMTKWCEMMINTLMKFSPTTFPADVVFGNCDGEYFTEVYKAGKFQIDNGMMYDILKK